MGRPHTPPCEAGSPRCTRAVEAWESFVDAFADFAVGGHVLPTRSPTTHPAGEGSRGDSPTPGNGDRNGTGIKQHHNEVVTPARIVALGDVHGDIRKAREALSIAGLIDGQDRWSGGEAVLVQVGDVLDRGGGEIEIFYLLEKLRHEARKAGGAVHTLLGNHETGNCEGWLRYASRSGLRDFRRWAAWQRWAISMVSSSKGPEAEPRPDPLDGVSSAVPPEQRARLAALMPSGPITKRFIADNPVTLRLGESLFVHGGVLPEHVEYGLDRINKEAQEWLRSAPTPEGLPKRAPNFFHTSKAIVWVRDYSHTDPTACNCEKLERTLQMIPGVSRMIVGHTIQDEGGVNAACGGGVVRVDVGMSKGCGDYAPEVLEILDGRRLRVLTRQGPPRALEVHYPEGKKEKAGLAVLVQSN